MARIAGEDAACQIGLETTWGTGVAGTELLPMTSESVEYMPKYLEQDDLVGAKTSTGMDIVGVKVGGDVNILVKPDSIGLVLAAALGTEAAAAQVGATTAYDHAFTLLASGPTATLPKVSVLIDRIVDVFRYVSCKITSVKFDAAAGDFLRGVMSVRGYDEEEGESLASISLSTLKPFKFSDASITVDASAFNDVTSMSFTLNNKVEDDLYTANSGDYMAEVEPGRREILASMEVLYGSANNTVRTNKFKAGASAALVFTFTSDSLIEAGYPYLLTITMPYCYITKASAPVANGDRLKQQIELKAVAGASEPLTITLRNAKTDEYLT